MKMMVISRHSQNTISVGVIERVAQFTYFASLDGKWEYEEEVKGRAGQAKKSFINLVTEG